MKLFGIDVSVHWSWWIFVAFISMKNFIHFDLTNILHTFLIISIVFFVVIGHELAHALTARHFGYETDSIVMHFLGGVANIDMAKATPRQVIIISAAGPLFNLWLAYITTAITLVIPSYMLLTPGDSDLTGLGFAVGSFFIINLLLGLFNLVPAYPMDGGRILRAALSKNPVLAIKVSHICSLLFSGIFLLFGLFTFNPVMILISIGLAFVVYAERNTSFKV